jgi:hypothetical protein
MPLQARLTSFIRPRASCYPLLPGTSPHASPGASSQPLPGSSRAADISTPGARICARSVYVAESDGLVMATADGLRAAGEVPSAPSTPAERLSLWCGRLPSRGPEMLRTLAPRASTSWMSLLRTRQKADRRSLEFRDRRPARQWPDRNRRSTRYRTATLFRE